MELPHFIWIALTLERVKDSTIITESLVLITSGIAIYNWRYQTKPYRVLFFLVLWGFLADMKILFPALLPWNDHILGIYVLSEILVYIYIITEIVPSNFLRKIRKYLYPAAFIMWLISYGKVLLLVENPITNGFNDAASSLMIVILAAYQLLQLTKRDEPVFRQPDFWILIGIFAYFMCCSFIFSFMTASFRSQIWFLHSIFFALKFILFSIGFIMIRNNNNPGTPVLRANA